MAQHGLAIELKRYGPQAKDARAPSRGEAAEYCRRLARSHYENFSLTTWLLPRRVRAHFYSIYAYCRWADDLADETHDPGESLRLLDWWQDQLERCYAGDPRHPVFVALRSTIEECSIPPDPFMRLLHAFRQDQVVLRYDTPQDVLAYASNSANPVGRLVLYVAGCHDESRGRLADEICTGLQLANFCQDVARDHQMGRIYLPRATLEAAGYSEAMFDQQVYNEAFCRAMQVEVDRAERCLLAGQDLIGRMPRFMRLQVALFVHGGRAILQAIRDLDYNVWRKRPTLSRARKLRLVGRAWWDARRGPKGMDS